MYKNQEGYADPTAGQALANIRREEKARLGYMPLVYICSPFRGDVEGNMRNARKYCAFALSRHALPIATHLLFPQFMGTKETPQTREMVSEGEQSEPGVPRTAQSAPQARNAGRLILPHGATQRMAFILLTRCNELWYFGDTVSEGMKKEISRARWRNIPVRHFTEDCKEVVHHV